MAAVCKFENKFPEVVLLNIFSYLPFKDLAAACCVSKKWNEISRLDVIWKRFIPLHEYVLLEDKSAYEMFAHMWRSSVKVGEERWYPNPLPELVEFDKELRKAERQQLMLDDNSTMKLMLRLNPIYDFTTKGKDANDPTINEICKTIWDVFGYVDEYTLEFTSYEVVIKKARLLSREKALNSVLKTLQPYWFLKELKNEYVDGDDDDDDEYGKRNSWKKHFNKPLSEDIWQKLKALFADKSEHFIEYYLSDGCFNENHQFAHSLVISDTAAYHIQQIFDI